MQYEITNEQPFQVLCSSFSISPSQQNYTLNISADGKNYSPLFTVASGQTRLVTGVASGSYYKLVGNQSEVTVNWVRSCNDGGGGTGGNAGELEPVTDFPVGAVAGTVVALSSGGTVGVYQYDGTDWAPIGGGDMSNYYTKAETDAAITGATQDFATKEFVTGATEEIYETMETKEEVVASALTELDARIIEISGNTPDLTNYYTKAETDAEITAATQNFVTEADITAATSPIQTQLDDVERVTATALTELHQDILDLSGATQAFVTSGDVETQISAATEDIFEMMETKEEVIAAALVDLNDNKVGSTSISTIVALTQAQYDVLPVKDPNTFYIITNN